MGRTSNLTKYECDRCGAKEIFTADAPGVADWQEITRSTAEGAQRHVLLCPACWPSYKDLVQQEDQSFNGWMAGDAK